jgi:hypothetical protein
MVDFVDTFCAMLSVAAGRLSPEADDLMRRLTNGFGSSSQRGRDAHAKQRITGWLRIGR